METNKLTLEFVDDQYFMDRVKYFETKYKMEWSKFYSLFQPGVFNSKEPEKQMDFSEWAFICERFWHQLLSKSEGPPGPEKDGSPQQPELSSGCLFLWRLI